MSEQSELSQVTDRLVEAIRLAKAEPRNPDLERREELHRSADVIVAAILLLGGALTTAYTVAALFVEGIEREWAGKGNGSPYLATRKWGGTP